MLWILELASDDRLLVKALLCFMHKVQNNHIEGKRKLRVLDDIFQAVRSFFRPITVTSKTLLKHYNKIHVVVDIEKKKLWSPFENGHFVQIIIDSWYCDLDVCWMLLKAAGKQKS